MTETYLKVGKSVLRNLFEYYELNSLDDEAEYFPLLKTIITGVIAPLDNPKEKENVKKQLTDFAKDEYIKTWIQNIDEDEDEDEPDINKATKEAAKYFDNSYNL